MSYNANRSNEPELAQEPAEVDISLEPCPICTRTFAPQTLKKHIVICERAAIKRRKTFDSSRQRREGTDLADFLPKNFGLPPSKQESKQSPADRTQRQGTTPLLQKKENDVAKVTLPAKKTVSSAPVVNSATKEKSKPILSRLVPTAEPCPHCGRSFGPKAYDRHVEWCKEKARIANSQYNPSVNVAKERLQARTKYKAPCLKSKRAVNREKYSGLSCDESMNSLSDGGSCGSTSKSKEYAQEGAGNTDISMVSTTMSSSLISEGAFSDKYDPFLSAKRQLEELCSPTESIPSNASLPATPDAKTHPDLMSKSLNINTTNKLKNIKSNFHRTSSLRVPRKTTPTRSIFASSTKQRPTIQRGISDEGPISTSFLKPEEYDEMPVKSVCINDFAATKHPDNHSTPKIMKREPNLSRNRRNLKTAFTSIEKKGVNPLSKTDSLAIFLQYEHATRVTEIPINLTEKDLKDQSNNLSKQTSSKSSASDLDTILAEKDKLYSLKNSLSSLLDPHHSAGNDKQLSQETTPVPITKIQAIKLDPLPKRLPKSNRSIFPSFPSISKDTEFIDPNLINVCDNLPINVTKLSDNDFTSSSTESVEQAVGSFESQFHLAERQEDNALQPQTTNRNSVEKKNLLKRQLRLGKNHFLYDLSPENDNENINYNNVSRAEIDSNKLDSSISTIDPIPDEFDIEEFISSFENVEEYPLFRDYKAFLSNRSLNKISNNSRGSSRSPTTLRRSNDEEDDHDEEKNEIFSSNESFLKHESDVVPKSAPCTIELNSTTKNLNLNDLNENKYDPPSSPDSDQENEETDIPDANENIRDVKDFIACEHFEDADPSNDTTDNSKDLSKPSSLESLEIKKSTSSKQSADSAYGSLSRYSPADCVSRRTPACKTLNEGTPEEPQRIREEHDNAKTGSCIRDLGRKPSIEELNLSQLELNQQHLATRIKTDVRMSKFCHECGSKFIITQAKFCMECGVKRIVLE